MAPLRSFLPTALEWGLYQHWDRTISSTIIVSSKYLIDAAGSSQIFFPTQNLERAYQFDEESKAVLSYFQYNQCAGPQKQEVINDHSSIIFWKKNEVREVF